VSCGEELITGHVGVIEFIKSQGREIQRGAWWGPGGIWRQRECASLLQVLLKSMLTSGKGRTR
jgi:hypothetical protein